MCLVFGGPAPAFFSKAVYDFVVYGYDHVKPIISDVADVSLRFVVNQVMIL